LYNHSDICLATNFGHLLVEFQHDIQSDSEDKAVPLNISQKLVKELR